MLSIENFSVRLGGFQILKDVSLQCAPGKITAVIGPNGAGKTTLFDAATGFVNATSGSVTCDDIQVPHLQPHIVARAGLSRTFQTPRLFEEMTVQENLAVAAPGSTLSSLLLSAITRHDEQRCKEAALQEATTFLDFLRLGPVSDNLTSDLSGGQRKLVELGRALMTHPRYLLLDEPVAGVAPQLVGEIGEHLRDLARQGLGILVIEHNMDFVMKHSDHVIVLVGGEVLTEGSADAVRADRRVLDAYLGGA